MDKTQEVVVSAERCNDNFFGNAIYDTGVVNSVCDTDQNDSKKHFVRSHAPQLSHKPHFAEINVWLPTIAQERGHSISSAAFRYGGV